MSLRHLWHDLLDWLDRVRLVLADNADMLLLVAVLGLLFVGVGTCAGSPDDGRGYITASPSPTGAVAAPGSLAHGGVEPGAARTTEVGP